MYVSLLSSSLSDTGFEVERNAEFLLTLSEGRHLSQVALDDVMGCRNHCKKAISQAKKGVLVALNDAGIDTSTIPRLEQSFSSVPADPFERIDTPYLCKKLYKEHFNYKES